MDRRALLLGQAAARRAAPVSVCGGSLSARLRRGHQPAAQEAGPMVGAAADVADRRVVVVGVKAQLTRAGLAAHFLAAAVLPFAAA